MFIDINMKKICAEFGHNSHLKIYVNPKKFTETHALLPNGFCQNMCHTDAFIEFLM